MNKSLLILGAGGHGKVVADCALNAGWQDISFLDDQLPSLGVDDRWPVIGKLSELEGHLKNYPNMALGLGIGYEQLRLDLFSQAVKAGARFPSIIHPRSIVSHRCSVGEGTVVCAGAIINIAAEVGRACIINTGAVIEHDAVVEDGCHISPGACLAGRVTVGEMSWIGMGAQCLQGVSIGRQALVGAGSVVLSDVADSDKVYGVPATSRCST